MYIAVTNFILFSEILYLMKTILKRFAILNTLIFILLFIYISDVSSQSERIQPLLADGTPYLTWSDMTNYTRVYHVDQNHPLASDKNDGTEGHPFLTINHAAQLVKAGERVRIHSGIYRELVRPRYSGEGADRMIAYEAAPGDQVIIRGSRVIKSTWTRSIDPNDKENMSRPSETVNPGTGNTFSKKIWMTSLPESFFENSYFAFSTPNCSDEEIDLMEWALRWKGRIPYSLPRGMIFQEGHRLTQLSTYEDLIRLPGSYWVAADGMTIHMHPFGGINPNGTLFEAAIQPHIFQPETAGTGFIRVSGLIIGTLCKWLSPDGSRSALHYGRTPLDN